MVSNALGMNSLVPTTLISSGANGLTQPNSATAGNSLLQTSPFLPIGGFNQNNLLAMLQQFMQLFQMMMGGGLGNLNAGLGQSPVGTAQNFSQPLFPQNNTGLPTTTFVNNGTATTQPATTVPAATTTQPATFLPTTTQSVVNQPVLNQPVLNNPVLNNPVLVNPTIIQNAGNSPSYGYTNNTGYTNTGYNTGYNTTVNNNNVSIGNGYGYNKGFANGYTTGYNNGFANGFNTGVNYGQGIPYGYQAPIFIPGGTTSRVWGDPHFEGLFHGVKETAQTGDLDGNGKIGDTISQKYDVMGRPGETYTVLSDSNLAINGKVGAWNGKQDATVFKEAGVTVRGQDGQLYTVKDASDGGAAPTVKMPNGQVVPLENGKAVQLGGGANTVTWNQAANDVAIKTPEYDVNIKKTPNSHLDINTKINAGFDGLNHDGLLGVSGRPDIIGNKIGNGKEGAGAQGEGVATKGPNGGANRTIDDYKVDNVDSAPGAKVNTFNTMRGAPQGQTGIQGGSGGGTPAAAAPAAAPAAAKPAEAKPPAAAEAKPAAAAGPAGAAAEAKPAAAADPQPKPAEEAAKKK